MSKNHGPIRFRGSDGMIYSVDNPLWRKQVKDRHKKEKLAKKARKKNR